MRVILLNLYLLFTLMVAFNAIATPQQEAELREIDVIQEKLSLQREWANYRFEKSSTECYSKFFTTSCLKNVKQIHDEEIRKIRSQEVPMHDKQRSIKEALKAERDKERAVERADPKKAEERVKNKRVYEEKQADKAQRQKDLDERRQDAERRSQENKTSSPF